MFGFNKKTENTPTHETLAEEIPSMPISKVEMTEKIIEAKVAKGTSWAAISEAAGLSEIFVTSACLGQNSMPADAAAKVSEFLGLGPDIATTLQAYPHKGQDIDTVSKDPLIYRFHEITYIYGNTIKEIIHEKLGDGIMSAIDFDMYIDKVENPKGDRVKVTMTGKFLPYNKW